MSSYPNALTSERAVLLAVLLDPGAYLQVSREIADDDWFLTQHATIWAVMRQLAEAGQLEAGTVRDVLSARHPGALASLVLIFDARDEVGGLSYHINRVTTTSTFRALVKAGQHLIQVAESSAALDTDPVALAETIIDELRLVQGMGTAERYTEIDLLDLIARPRDPNHYVIPGLLARGNRIIITAPEGYGKSTLLRQLACCAAGGVHPFKPLGRIRPVNVLVIDAENPAEINTDEYSRLTRSLDAMDAMPERDTLWVEESGSMNLLDGREAARMYTLIERRQPELIVIGPLYQLHEENPNDEGPARKLSAVLDRMRRISGAALITEAHTPHNDDPARHIGRPYGASLWKRWPEFGYCLHPMTVVRANETPTDDQRASLNARDSHFSTWRGSRAIRDWPNALRAGSLLPWVVSA